jgi:hypothetical protein
MQVYAIPVVVVVVVVVVEAIFPVEIVLVIRCALAPVGARIFIHFFHCLKISILFILFKN